MAVLASSRVINCKFTSVSVITVYLSIAALRADLQAWEPVSTSLLSSNSTPITTPSHSQKSTAGDY